MSFRGNKTETTADPAGNWRVELGASPAGGPFEMVVQGTNEITISDVLVGEVWVCSGQSNMEWPVSKSLNAEQEIASATDPMIRLFGVDAAICKEPDRELAGTWAACTPESVRGFSAVAFFYAKQLRKKIKVPVGLIQTSLGDTPAEAWISRKGLESDLELRGIIQEWNDSQAAKAAGEGKGGTSRPTTQAATAPEAGGLVNAYPENRTSRKEGHRQAPTVLFNGMIYPLIPYRIAGVLWYQGEANVGQAERYRHLFPALIRDWREHWGQGDFPFLFVQLPNYGERRGIPVDSHWAELREAQAAALKLPNTGMVVTIDVGEEDDIHPKNKQEVGLRLALTAEALFYGQRVVCTGPVYYSMRIEGSSIRIIFQSIANVVGARGQQPLKGFAIAGEDRKFYWADAKIDKNTVVVRSDQVAQPVAVRYAWADNPECNLTGVFGLPTAPFRTDDWPSGKTGD